MTDKKNFSKYDRTFENNLIYGMATDRVFCDRISEVLELEFFTQEPAKQFAMYLLNYKNNYGSHPSLSTFRTVLINETSSESDTTKASIMALLSKVERMRSEDVDVEYEKDTAIAFCRHQKVVGAVMKGLSHIESENYEALMNTISKAVNAGDEKTTAYDYIADFDVRFEAISRNPVVTGWPIINRITQGGLGRGELGVVIAPSGAGKSMFLVHLGAEAIKNGKNVVHYTLELLPTAVAQRYDSCITGIKLNDLMDHKDKIRDEIKKVEGSLKIQSYPTRYASTNTIIQHLEKLKQKEDFRPDLIIVDYGDLLKPVVHSATKRSDLETIYEELRGIGQQFNAAVWTASQTNRSGMNKEVVTTEEISEAFNKVFVADLIITLARTQEDKNFNDGRILVAKNRNGADGIVYPIYMDTSSVTINVKDMEYIEDKSVKTSMAKEMLKKMENRKNK